MQAWLLCILVPPHTSLIMVVNLGSLHWALSLFKYFRSVSGLLDSCCRWPTSKRIVSSTRSIDFVRSRFTRPATRGRAWGAKTPLENFSPPLEKCVGYILKLLDIVQKIWAPQKNLPSWCPKLVMGLRFTRAHPLESIEPELLSAIRYFNYFLTSCISD